MVAPSNESEIERLRARVELLEEEVDHVLKGTRILASTVCVLLQTLTDRGIVDCPMPKL